ncbi:MAG: acetyl-CoA carboxylase biotin carboxyl carrier protein [Chlamydiae bacterium]|nr:acetyl-CoA carboxylase biotin carboxyl carrier protein [Chlamydiota bacterium]
MDLKQIKELMAAMEKAGIKRVKLRQEKGFEIELERYEEPFSQPAKIHPHPSSRIENLPHPHFPPHHPSTLLHSTEEERQKQKEVAPGRYVTSPMVGTFYSAPSPEDPVFVKIGDRVEEDTIICIIEAMKVMNEVKAGVKGEIAEILVENTHPVEFGTKLFRVI